MSRDVSARFRAAAFAQQTEEAFVVLLRISHPNLTEDILLSSDPTELLPNAGVRGTISRGEEYVFLPFEISLPTDDDTGIARASLSIDNVAREIVQAVRTATSELRVKIEIVLASTPDALEYSSHDFRLSNVTYDALTVSGDLTVEYYDREPFPCKRFTPSDFPGIF